MVAHSNVTKVVNNRSCFWFCFVKETSSRTMCFHYSFLALFGVCPIYFQLWETCCRLNSISKIIYRHDLLLLLIDNVNNKNTPCISGSINSIPCGSRTDPKHPYQYIVQNKELKHRLLFKLEVRVIVFVFNFLVDIWNFTTISS